MLGMIENGLSVSRNGYLCNFNQWGHRGVVHLADHVFGRLCKGIPFEKPPRPRWEGLLDHIWTIFGRSRYVSRSMSRTKIRIETSSHRLKRGESTLHSELRRFLDFHNLRIQGGRDPFGLQFDFRNFRALARPAGRAGHALQSFIVMGNLRLQLRLEINVSHN